MSRFIPNYTTVPLQGFSLDLATFSAMSFFASEMNLPLNDAIRLALNDWLAEAGRPVDRLEN